MTGEDRISKSTAAQGRLQKVTDQPILLDGGEDDECALASEPKPGVEPFPGQESGQLPLARGRLWGDRFTRCNV